MLKTAAAVGVAEAVVAAAEDAAGFRAGLHFSNQLYSASVKHQILELQALPVPHLLLLVIQKQVVEADFHWSWSQVTSSSPKFCQNNLADPLQPERFSSQSRCKVQKFILTSLPCGWPVPLQGIHALFLLNAPIDVGRSNPTGPWV